MPPGSEIVAVVLVREVWSTLWHLKHQVYDNISGARGTSAVQGVQGVDAWYDWYHCEETIAPALLDALPAADHGVAWSAAELLRANAAPPRAEPPTSQSITSVLWRAAARLDDLRAVDESKPSTRPRASDDEMRPRASDVEMSATSTSSASDRAHRLQDGRTSR